MFVEKAGVGSIYSTLTRGQSFQLFVGSGSLVWSNGLDASKEFSSTTARQIGGAAMAIRSIDGKEGFSGTMDGDNAAEIYAVDLPAGTTRRIARLEGDSAGYELEASPLPSDAAYIYFNRTLAGPGRGLWRVARDGHGKPEALGVGPSSSSLSFVVDGGYVYWYEKDDNRHPALVRRRVERGSQPVPLVDASSRDFQIADGYIYFVKDGAIWSAHVDGSSPLRRTEVGVYGARNILVDGGCVYWIGVTAALRLTESTSTGSTCVEIEFFACDGIQNHCRRLRC